MPLTQRLRWKRVLDGLRTECNRFHIKRTEYAEMSTRAGCYKTGFELWEGNIRLTHAGEYGCNDLKAYAQDLYAEEN